jgi:hypothetical protein
METTCVNGSLFLQFMKGRQDVVRFRRFGNRLDLFIHSVALLIARIGWEPFGNQGVHSLLEIQVAPANLMHMYLPTLLHPPECGIGDMQACAQLVTGVILGGCSLSWFFQQILTHHCLQYFCNGLLEVFLLQYNEITFHNMKLKNMLQISQVEKWLQVAPKEFYD